MLNLPHLLFPRTLAPFESASSSPLRPPFPFFPASYTTTMFLLYLSVSSPAGHRERIFTFRPPLPPSVLIRLPFAPILFSFRLLSSLLNFVIRFSIYHHILSEFERLQVAFAKDVKSRWFFSKGRFVVEQPLAEQEESL